MRSSSIIALIGATLAIASPVHQKLHKKAIVWDVVTDVVYVTVTEGQLPSSHPETTVTVEHTHYVNPVPAPTSEKVVPTTTSTPPPPPPPPSSTSTPPPPPPAPTPEPEAPAPAPVKQEPAPVVVKPQQAAPAVFAAVNSPAPAPVVEAPAPAPVVDSTPKDSAPQGFAGAALSIHNEVRKLHQVPDVQWDQNLASLAQKHANSCSFKHNMGMNGVAYGQNINMQGSSNKVSYWNPSSVIADSVINGWYTAEQGNFKKNGLYNQANPDVMKYNAAHFTQVVWKSTTTIGCASSFCGKQPDGFYEWFTVCNYGPSGNFADQYAKNVNQPTGAPAPVKAMVA